MKGDQLERQGSRAVQSSLDWTRAARIGDHAGRQSWETRRQRQLRAAPNEVKGGCGSGGQEPPRMGIGRESKCKGMKGDKAAASRPSSNFGDQQPSHQGKRISINFSYLRKIFLGLPGPSAPCPMARSVPEQCTPGRLWGLLKTGRASGRLGFRGHFCFGQGLQLRGSCNQKPWGYHSWLLPWPPSRGAGHI